MKSLKKKVMEVAPIFGLFTTTLKNGTTPDETALSLQLMQKYLKGNGVENPAATLAKFAAAAIAANEGNGVENPTATLAKFAAAAIAANEDCQETETKSDIDWAPIHELGIHVDATTLGLPHEAQLLFAAVTMDVWLPTLVQLSTGTKEEFKEFYNQDSTTKYSQLAEWFWDRRTPEMLKELNDNDYTGKKAKPIDWEGLDELKELDEETLAPFELPQPIHDILTGDTAVSRLNELGELCTDPLGYIEFFDEESTIKKTQLVRYLWEHKTPGMLDAI